MSLKQASLTHSQHKQQPHTQNT